MSEGAFEESGESSRILGCTIGEYVSTALARTGQGDWAACTFTVKELEGFALAWKARLGTVSLPWLCWNVDSDWCYVQQLLVDEVGWTPVVGYDPRVGPPKKTTQSAIVVDFNAEAQLPLMYPHFVIELMFLFAERLAFWHSDLFVRLPLLKKTAAMFHSLPPGATCTVPERRLRQRLFPDASRFWELIGCTTKEASYRQFQSGAGWWMNHWCHPNSPLKGKRPSPWSNWDHGAGIMHWHRWHRGTVLELKAGSFDEGHFTQIGKKDYKRVSPKHYLREMGNELSLNFELHDALEKLDLIKLYADRATSSR